MSILLSALDAMPERDIVFVHASLNESVQAFKPVVDALAKQHSKRKVHHRYSDAGSRSGNASTGFVDAALIESLVPGRDADYFFCGPHPFMVNIYHDLLKWGIPGSQVHFEFFGPRHELERVAR